MPRPNRTEPALLGLLALEPRSGYDLKQAVAEQLSHFWSESFGNIYPTLRRLQERGWLSAREEREQGRPPRTVYSVTSAGREALDRWLARPVEPVRPRNELLLRMFLGPLSDPVALAGQVRQEAERWRAELATLEEVLGRLEAGPGAGDSTAYWALTAAYGVRVFRALLEWSEEASAALAYMAEGGGDG